MTFFRQHRADLVVAVAAMLWGLFWIPLRAFERNGLDPLWASLFQFLAPLIVLAPFALYRLFRGRGVGLRQWDTGLLVGAAFVLYFTSLFLTDVVRALILFYVTPAWGTLLEVSFMGRRFTRWRGLVLLLSLFGLAVILIAGGNRSVPLNAGDVLALASGILFSLGAMRVRVQPEVALFEQVFAFFLYGCLAALLLFLLPLDELGSTPGLDVVTGLLPWILLMSVGFLIPVMAGIYWGSRQVDPGRMGILLQLEVIVGIASAALLANEPFGPLEAAGGALVISAGFVEVFINRNPSPAPVVSS